METNIRVGTVGFGLFLLFWTLIPPLVFVCVISTHARQHTHSNSKSILNDAIDYTTNSSWRVHVPVNSPHAAVVLWVQAGGDAVNQEMCGVQAQVVVLVSYV